MGGSAEVGGEIRDIGIILSGSVSVIAVDILDLSDAAVADDHAGGAELAPGALHGAGLEDAFEFFLSLHDQQRFLDGIGQRFFAVDILSGLHGGAGDVGMPVIGSCDADGVDLLILDDVAEIGDGFALGQLRFPVLFIVIVHEFGSGFPTDPVTVADRFDDHIFLFDDVRDQNGASLNTVTDESDVDGLLRGSGF